MKKILLVLTVLTCVGVTAKCQYMKKIRVGLSGGFVKAVGPHAGGGLAWAVEPGYPINSNVLANFRVEGARMNRGTSNETAIDFNAAGVCSYSLNGQYYLSNSRLRTFAGVGFGVYNLSSTGEPKVGGPTDKIYESKFGFYPRFGFDLRHFTFCIDYNIISKSITRSAYTTTEFNNSYIALRVGGYFGGGRK